MLFFRLISMTSTHIRTLRHDVDRVQSSSSASSSPSTNRHIATLPLQHAVCKMTTITCKRDWTVSVTAAITRVLKSLVTGSFQSLLIYFLTLVSK